jgi:hypothetical protein
VKVADAGDRVAAGRGAAERDASDAEAKDDAHRCNDKTAARAPQANALFPRGPRSLTTSR